MSPVTGLVYSPDGTELWESGKRRWTLTSDPEPDPATFDRTVMPGYGDTWTRPLAQPMPDTTGISGLATAPTFTTDARSTIDSDTTWEDVRFTHATPEVPDGRSNVTFRRCRFDGQLQVREATNVTIEDTDAEGIILDGTHGVRVRRVHTDAYDGSDGFQVKAVTGAVPTDLVIEDSFLGGAVLSANSHYDGIQMRGVRGITIRGCTFRPTHPIYAFNDSVTAAIFLEGANGGNHDVWIHRNWLSSPGYKTLLIGSSISNVQVTDNVFLQDEPVATPVSSASNFTFGESGNTWEDGTPLVLGGITLEA